MWLTPTLPPVVSQLWAITPVISSVSPRITLITQAHLNRVVPMGIDERLVQRPVCYSRVVVPTL